MIPMAGQVADGTPFEKTIPAPEFSRLRQYVHDLMEETLQVDVAAVEAKHNKPQQKSVRRQADKDRIIADTQKVLPGRVPSCGNCNHLSTPGTGASRGCRGHC